MGFRKTWSNDNSTRYIKINTIFSQDIVLYITDNSEP